MPNVKTCAMARILSLRIESDKGGTWDFFVPAGWLVLRVDGGALAFFLTNTGARVAVSVGDFDGVDYIHASVSREGRMPDYADLVALKDAAFGPTRYAAAVFPPAKYHVNIHSTCLHLWGPLDPTLWTLPEFGAMGTI